MGAENSTPVPGGGTEGYHVLRVQENSPGHKAGLEAFFDFIIAIGNTRLNEDNENLRDLLIQHKDKPVRTLVYSSKTQSCREVTLVPCEGWGGQGLLGVSIRFCSFDGANENVWHVMDVQPNSPAGLAGLQSDTDYIIGADTLLQDYEDLITLIEAHDGKPLKLYVYSTVSDSCREVTITPNSVWGGEGLLGCGIGYGYLHRIPTREPPVDQLTPLPSDVMRAPASDGFTEVPLSSAAATPSAAPAPVSSPLPPPPPPPPQSMPPPTYAASQSLPSPPPPPPPAPVSAASPLPPPPPPLVPPETSTASPAPPPPQQQQQQQPADLHLPPVSTELTLPGMPPVSVNVPPIDLPPPPPPLPPAALAADTQAAEQPQQQQQQSESTESPGVAP
ncbi:hypothetical protein BOX15_Mlig005266g1 [Macrostomum lignano]|uniref:PDZ GRASP-type domain-containing protein n=1 Tax=Macrostomum lignano TaxID=282301 RepID=A0A267GSL0_9PLAT|nr:hypothetical protein BOX15_Mlig005266g1 [Macrostomum lignano]